MPVARGAPQSIGSYYPDAEDPQTPAQVGIVIPTLMRPSIAQALETIYGQEGVGRIQVVIGVDVAQGSSDPLEEALSRRPDHVSAVVVQLPYSTSVRHGGVHRALDGGALRTLLSYIVNSRYVAYLDDDNIWTPDHLSSLLAAVKGKCWAHSQRLLIDEETGDELGVDRWHSVGADLGQFAEQGGYVDTNCLLIDKIRAGRPLGRWSEGPGLESDRAFFWAIKHLPHGSVDRPTVRYGVRRVNALYHLARGTLDPSAAES